MSRPSWDTYFMELAKKVATRTTCYSPPKGAVIIINQKVISTGYSGAPSHLKECRDDIGYCRRKEAGYASGEGLHICKAAHAEANAIVLAARNGSPTDGATLYTTHLPCCDCTKLIINAGIKEVIYSEDYPGSEAKEWFAEAGVSVRLYSEMIEVKIID